MVHREPFGGFGMSGVETKAGGPGYLLNFAEPRAVSKFESRHFRVLVSPTGIVNVSTESAISFSVRPGSVLS